MDKRGEKSREERSAKEAAYWKLSVRAQLKVRGEFLCVHESLAKLVSARVSFRRGESSACDHSLHVRSLPNANNYGCVVWREREGEKV